MRNFLAVIEGIILVILGIFVTIYGIANLEGGSLFVFLLSCVFGLGIIGTLIITFTLGVE